MKKLKSFLYLSVITWFVISIPQFCAGLIESLWVGSNIETSRARIEIIFPGYRFGYWLGIREVPGTVQIRISARELEKHVLNCQ